MRQFIILFSFWFLFPSDDFFKDIDLSFDAPALTWKDSIPDNMPLIKKPFGLKMVYFEKLVLLHLVDMMSC